MNREDLSVVRMEVPGVGRVRLGVTPEGRHTDLNGLPYPECWIWLASAPDVSVRTLQELKQWQGNRCAICGRSPSVWLALDHDAWSGLIRGFLCWSCKLAVAERLNWPGEDEFGRYRQRHPGLMFGLRVDYGGHIRALPRFAGDVPVPRTMGERSA